MFQINFILNWLLKIIFHMFKLSFSCIDLKSSGCEANDIALCYNTHIPKQLRINFNSSILPLPRHSKTVWSGYLGAPIRMELDLNRVGIMNMQAHIPRWQATKRVSQRQILKSKLVFLFISIWFKPVSYPKTRTMFFLSPRCAAWIYKAVTLPL